MAASHYCSVKVRGTARWHHYCSRRWEVLLDGGEYWLSVKGEVHCSMAAASTILSVGEEILLDSRHYYSVKAEVLLDGVRSYYN